MEAHTFDPEAVSEEQRNSFFEIASGKHGDSLMEVFSFACPTIHEPVIALVEWEFDLENRTGRVKVGDALELEVETPRRVCSDVRYPQVPQARTSRGATSLRKSEKARWSIPHIDPAK